MSSAHEAARDGRVDTLRTLVRQLGPEAALLAIDELGWCPAHMAARNGHCECLRFMAEEHDGMGLTARNIHGGTPAHLAARGGHVAALWLLF